jgi:hypothetical protein
MSELKRLRAQGATHFVLAAPSFWYIDTYQDFTTYLLEHHPCVLDNQRVRIFDLR